MPRRRADEAAVAESDSFLDIIANIVGILIILIVIVGMRVGQSTLATNQEPQSLAVAKVAVQPVLAPRPSIVNIPEAAPLVADPQLLAAIESTALSLRVLEEKRTDFARTSAALGATIEKAKTKREQLTADQAEISARLAAIDSRSQEAGKLLAALRAAQRNVNEQLSDVPAENVKVVKHKLNPIGRAVRGEEVHFRLAAGRISHVPLQAFVDRLKTRMRNEKEHIARVDRFDGQIGPYDGYLMQYVFERGRLNLAEQLNRGSQVVRISLTGWKVVPQPTLVAETVDEAIAPSSRFRQVLRQTSASDVLTFWVYPDSFQAYRRLQQFAHDHGFDVAARPLPRGVPIAGSPNGSRSSSQ